MPRLLTPNVNFTTTSPSKVLLRKSPSAVLYGADHLRQTAQKCGYGGIELHALRAPHIGQLALRTPAGVRLIREVFAKHQGWRGVGEPIPADPGDAIRPLAETQDSRLAHYKTKAIFLDGNTSLDVMDKWQERAVGIRPGMRNVIYPDIHGRRDVDRATAARHSHAGAQPTKEIAASWAIDSPAGYTAEFLERNLEVIADNFHLTRQGKTTEGPALDQEQYLRAFLAQRFDNDSPLVGAAHFGVFRGDFAKVDRERVALSYEEGRALATGSELPQGRHGEDLRTTIALLREANWMGDVTIEAPLAYMAPAMGYNDGISEDQMINLHQSMVSSVKDHMDWIPNEYWMPMAAGHAA